MRFQCRRAAAVAVCGLVAGLGLASAQSFEIAQPLFFALQLPNPPEAPKTPAKRSGGNRRIVESLKIVPLEGHNASNIITTGTTVAPVITVLDNNDRPVEGAAVTFEAPASGAGGDFGNGERVYQSMSDIRGQAGALRFRANAVAGKFTLRIVAKYQEASAIYLMQQTNYTSMEEVERTRLRQRPLWKSWKFWAVAGGAAAGGGIAAALLSGGSSPVSVVAGPVSFGNPR